MSFQAYFETFQQANSPKGTMTSRPEVMARVLRYIPKELSFQYEASSVVYVDDDSQKLFDRWNDEEVWAFVPGKTDYYTTASGNHKILLRDVSDLRLEYAFARTVPAVADNVQLASLVLAKNIVASSVREGIRASNKIIDRLVESDIPRANIGPAEDAIHTVSHSSGFTLMFNPHNFCGGAVAARLTDDRWNVSIVKEMASALLPDWGENAPLITAELTGAGSTATEFMLQLNADRIGRDTILGIKNWNEKIKLQDKKRNESGYEYSVALSFAGEDRKIAEDIATCLILNGFKVFYDEFEKAEAWGEDLHEYLASIYQNRASYCLMLISESYLKKYWTKYELQNILSRARSKKWDFILPVYLDDSEIPDLRTYVVGVKYEEFGTEGLVELIAEKIRT